MTLISETLKHIHFIGICGTAMASLAALLKKRGYTITGSDSNVYPPMDRFLEDHQILIQVEFSESNLTPQPDLVVIGNAVSRGNPEVEAVLDQGLRYISQAELLREFFIRGTNSIVVTGTHGKTTTTSLLAWIFEQAGKQPGFMIGGISENFGTSCQEGGGDYFITEGDEYDTVFFDKRSKFFHYQPRQLIINNLEYDHADIFASLEDIKRSFRYMLRLVPRSGVVLANGDDANVQDVVKAAHSPILTYGFGEACDIRGSDIQIDSEGTSFRMDWPGQCQQVFRIPLTGEYNVRNALAAISLALKNGIPPVQIQEAFKTFCNVKRRQELRGIRNGIYIYDDFAHHPTAIAGTIGAIRQKHPGHRLISVFEPRSNTSVQNIHQEALIQAFAETDWGLLAPPHRLEKIPLEKRLDAAYVKQQVEQLGKQFWTFDDVLSLKTFLQQKAEPGDVILIMSNGKFDNLHQWLLDHL